VPHRNLPPPVNPTCQPTPLSGSGHTVRVLIGTPILTGALVHLGIGTTNRAPIVCAIEILVLPRLVTFAHDYLTFRFVASRADVANGSRSV
jgi:hypothetical protein